MARIAAAIGVAALAAGCSPMTENSSAAGKTTLLSSATPISVLVTNNTCVAGHCDSVDVLAFPANQPDTPGGFWSLDLGVITTPTACVTLPASANFYVIASATNDTTTFSWTTGDSVAIGSLIPASGLTRFEAKPSTAMFLPASAAGWSASLPGNQATAGAACTP